MTGLSIPVLPPGCAIGQAAILYAECGWYVLPVDPADAKNPGSRVGNGWQYQSSRDPAVIAAWWQLWPGSNLALHTGRSGAVAFDADHPENMPAVLRRYLAAAAFQPTRTAGERGHYVFSCEPMRYGCSLKGGLETDPGWGEVKSGNSVIIAYPSLHPKAATEGGQYGGFRPGAVPRLPDELAACLLPPGATRYGPAADSGTVLAFLAGLPAHPELKCRKAAEQLEAFPPDEGSRYPAVRSRTLALARLGEQHHYGVPAALDELQEIYATALAGENRDSIREYTALLAGAVQLVLADPTPDGGPPRESWSCCGAIYDEGWLTAVTTVSSNQAVQPPQSASGQAPGGHGFGDMAGWVPGQQAAPSRLRLRDGAWLGEQEFTPLAYHVDGIVPEGGSLLIGPPKAGKSWLVLKWAKDRAQAGHPVVYFALEDGDRRMQRRLRMLGAWKIPREFRYQTELPEDIFGAIAEAAMIGDEPPLIIVDPLGAVLPPARQGETTYSRDYLFTRALVQSATNARPGCALLIVHHDRKMSAADFIDSASGTKGLTGAVDAILVLSRRREENEGLLSVTGRDVDERVYAITFSRGAWTFDGGSLDTAAEAARERRAEDGLGDQSADIVAFIGTAGKAVTAATVADAVGIKQDTAGRYLRRLATAGRIKREGRGQYVSVPSPDNPLSGVSACPEPTPTTDTQDTGGESRGRDSGQADTPDTRTQRIHPDTSQPGPIAMPPDRRALLDQLRGGGRHA